MSLNPIEMIVCQGCVFWPKCDNIDVLIKTSNALSKVPLDSVKDTIDILLRCKLYVSQKKLGI